MERSLLFRIVVKLYFQLSKNVDIFSPWVPFSQEHKQTKRLTGGIQRGGCRTCGLSLLLVVFYQQKKRVNLIKFAKLK